MAKDIDITQVKVPPLPQPSRELVDVAAVLPLPLLPPAPLFNHKDEGLSVSKTAPKNRPFMSCSSFLLLLATENTGGNTERRGEGRRGLYSYLN